MLRRRFLVPLAALLALAVAVPVFFGGGSHAQSEEDVVAFENPAPSASAELRVWQSVRQPLGGIWLSARPDADSSWTTSRLHLAMIEGGGWRVANHTVDAPGGEIEVRLWQDPAATDQVWLSARPAEGSWDEYGTQRLTLDQRSRSGRYRYADVSVALEMPDAEPPSPETAADALCIPEGLETERLHARVWRSVATPHRYWISSRPDTDSRWDTRRVTLAGSAVEGWNAGALTVDAGEADFELRLWEGEDDGALHLSVRVAGTTWHEYGTHALTLNRTSLSGRYDYANRVVRLTLPEAEPPAPGAAARTWDCPETGDGDGAPGTETGDGTSEPEATPTPDPDNRRPWADAGDDQTVNVGDTVTLDGSGSADPDEDAITYSWTQTGGSYTGAVALTGADTVSPSFTVEAALSGQTVEFTLTVTDEGGLTRTDAVTITVRAQQTTPPPGGGPPTGPSNQAPTANAGTDQRVNRGSEATLDGSASSDPDGDDFTFAWVQTGGSPTVTLTGEDTATPSFTVPTSAAANAAITFTLTVSDGTLSDTATVTVTALNVPPTAEAGTSKNAARGSTVTLNGSGSSDAEGALSYRWAKTGGTYTEAVALIPQVGGPDHTRRFIMPTAPSVNDTLIFTLTVTDSDGAANADTVTITALNAKPIANAGPDLKASPGAALMLSSSASDPDGDDSTLRYKWQVVGTPTASLAHRDTATPTLYVPASATSAARYMLTFTVTDADGETASDTMKVTANNASPIANAGADQTADRASAVTLSGSGSDPNMDRLSYSWARPTGAAGGTYSDSITLTNATSRNASFTMPADAEIGDTLIFTLTLSDGRGGTDTDTVKVTARNALPTVNPADQNVTAGVPVTLNANANDPDGPLTYDWSGVASLLSSTTVAAPIATIPANFGKGTTFDFTVEVTDEDGATASGDLTLTVDNRRPTANAGADADIGRTTIVTLDGSGSDDLDGDELTYSWAKTDGDYLGNISITHATPQSASASFTAPNVDDDDLNDTIIFTLTVSDGKGGTHTDTVKFTLKNAPPTLNPLTAVTVTPGVNATVTATASDPDGDDSAITYAWASDDAPLFVNWMNTDTQTVTMITPGDMGSNWSWTLTVTVTDEDGGTASATVDVTVP